MSKKYHVVNQEDKVSEIAFANNELQINGKSVNWDITSPSTNKKNVIIDNKVYNIEVESCDIKNKEITILVNDRKYSFKIREEIDILLNNMGMLGQTQVKVDNIKAPMPGLVVKILVEVGQSVEKGDAIIVLEAMKMENIIKATGAGIIKKINVSNKEAVEKNSVLIEME